MGDVMEKIMKAIVKSEGKQGLVLIDKPIPVIDKNEVLVKILKSAICGTDLHIYKWDSWAKNTIVPPMTIGHEFVGEIVQIGENVQNLQIGEVVSAEGHVVCGACRHCITGRAHLCRQTKGLGVNIDGVFAQYAKLNATNIWRCDTSIPQQVLSIQDPLGNAVHTALSFNVVGEDVLITGAGPIGQMAIPILKMAGARHIVITDINPKRLQTAIELGASAALDVRTQKIEDTIKRLNMAEGFDVGLEMSGNPKAFADMIDNMANGGKIAILGLLPESLSINWSKVIFNSLTLKGIYGREMYDTWYKMTSLLQSGLTEKIQKIITHEFDYTAYQEAFDLLLSGDGGKVVLNWA